MSVIYRFSKEVCRCRAGLGMTQEQLAEALSIYVLGISGKDLRDEG